MHSPPVDLEPTIGATNYLKGDRDNLTMVWSFGQLAEDVVCRLGGCSDSSCGGIVVL